MKTIKPGIRFAIGLAIILIAVIGAAVWKHSTPKEFDPRTATLEEAAEIGEAKIYQMLVQISEPPGRPPETKDAYHRGDIVQLADENKQWSIAEQEGFLIIKTRLTESQAGMIVRSKEKETGEKDKSGETMFSQEALREFYIDINKIGIANDDQNGRVISDQVFDWEDIVKRK